MCISNMIPEKMKYLNLGCGSRFHPDWENVDIYPYAPGIRIHDLTKKTPYAGESFSAIYHSHVLEHFPRRFAITFLRECYRLLTRGGVIRVAVPDLEQIARLYLESLEKASRGIPGWAENYEWMVMDMYDQCIREESCGALMEYFNRDRIPNREFIRERWGIFADSLIKGVQQSAARTFKDHTWAAKRAWGYVLRNPREVLRNKIVRGLLGRSDWEALQVGRFRRAGEIHMWMYDHHSLGKLLESAGFWHTARVGPTESRIPGWADFHLDAEPDGQVYKADSLYMEAVKP
jgi:predicted SAM-dependent methyltransferase